MAIAKNLLVGAWLISHLGGCFALSDADDFSVSDGRELDFTMRKMAPHRAQLVDIALVAGEANNLRSHAKVILPDAPATNFPDENLLLTNVLGEDGLRLFFYADVDMDGVFDPRVQGSNAGDHTWIEPVPANGIVDFEHNIMFVNIEEVTPIGANLIIRLEDTPMGFTVGDAINALVDDVFEARVFLDTNGSEVGLYRVHPGPMRPDELKIEGIVDSGNVYTIELWVDGERQSERTLMAPTMGDFVVTIPASEVLANSDQADIIDRIANGRN